MKNTILLVLLTLMIPCHAAQFQTSLLIGETEASTIDPVNGAVDTVVDNTWGIRHSWIINENIHLEINHNNYGQSVNKEARTEEIADEHIHFSVKNKASFRSGGIGIKSGVIFNEGDTGLYMRGGLLRWDADIRTFNYSNELLSVTDHGISPYLGIIIEQKLANNFKIGLDHSAFYADMEFEFGDYKRRIKNTALVLSFNY